MISIIFCGDIKVCPYLQRYTERLDIKNADYEVLFWNRAGLQLQVEANYKYYDKASDESLGKGKKLIDFLGFRSWVKRQLRQTEPDGLIFLSTLSAVLLWDVAEKYKNRFVFDIRDYSYENIALFKSVESRIISNSCFTAISSRGFRAFLPEGEYVLAHNFNRNEMTEPFGFVRQDLPLPIVWNGTVRFFDYQKKYLDVFQNDPRFMLIYHGAGTDLERYRVYCREKDIQNVRFTGAYDNREKRTLLQNAAFLNNCYGGRNGDALKYAVSNRFYDGIVYHIPQIVEESGYKAQEVKRFDVGLAVEPDPELPDRLYQYYCSLDKARFDGACDKAMKEILAEDDLFVRRIDAFISKFGE